MNKHKPLLGLVLCGGKSTRMGQDKGKIIYQDLPQRVIVQNMLLPHCKLVVLSCNRDQLSDCQAQGIPLPDAPEYDSIGPMAALLTAQQRFPHHDIIALGCDYPLFDADELAHFLTKLTTKDRPQAFFNEQGFYEPLLAFYPSHSLTQLRNQYMQGIFSLQYFLKQNQAVKHQAKHGYKIQSVDTHEAYKQILAQLNREPNP